MNSDEIKWLKEYVDAMFRELQRQIDNRLGASDRHYESDTKTLRERLAGMNEIREQLREQAETFARKDAVERTEKRLDVLENARSNLEGRIVAMGVVITFISVLVQVVVKVFWKSG